MENKLYLIFLKLAPIKQKNIYTNTSIHYTDKIKYLHKNINKIIQMTTYLHTYNNKIIQMISYLHTSTIIQINKILQ